MKKIVLPLAVLIFCTAAAAQTAAQTVALTASPTASRDETPRHLDPRVVAMGRELPRGEVVSHDSKADAVRRTYGPARYLQPLTEWTRTEQADAVTYTTQFKIPFGWIDRRQFLYLGRVSGPFDVAVNGRGALYSQTGSTPVEFDVTQLAKEGMNDLAVTIYKTGAEQALAGGRTPSAPAIEGEAHILSQPRERVRDVSISTRMEGTSGLMELGVIFKSHRLNAHAYTVLWELLNPAGEIVAEGKKDARLDMRREDTVRFFANIPRVVPWSHESPHLYTLYVKTQNEGRVRENLSFRVGFRSVALDPADGTFYLNGEALRMTMRDYTPPSDAAQMAADITRLRAGGTTGLMLTGAPRDRAFFALCDSLGMYVVCRADIDTHHLGSSRKVGGNPSNDPAWTGAYLDRTMAMYHTAKNHPSVIMFSLAGPSANGYNLYESYTALKAAEPQRPVIYASAEGEWNTDAVDLAASPDDTGDTVEAAVATSSTSSTSSTADNALVLTAVDAAAGSFRLANRRHFTPFAGEAVYSVRVGRKVVASGDVPVEAMPGEEIDIKVPVTGTKPNKPYSVTVEVAAERADGDYLPDGDPGMKVYRRLDLPIPAAARTVVAASEHRTTFKKGRPTTVEVTASRRRNGR